MSYRCTKVQMGLQSTLDTGVAATHIWAGEAEFDFLDQIAEEQFLSGEPGGAIEDTNIRGTGSQLTLKDTPSDFYTLIYLLNTSVKAIAGPATSFPFPYPVPGTFAPGLSMFTWEIALAAQVTQEYEFYNGFAPTWNLHGDADANGGQMLLNAMILGSKAAPSTLTSSLAYIPVRSMMNLRAASWDLNAIGTAFETPPLASPRTGALKVISIEQKKGYHAGYYAEARTAKDFGTIEGGNDYELGGKVTGLLNSDMVTEIANARSATGKVMQLTIPGPTTTLCDIRLPIVWTSVPKILSEVRDGMVMVSFDYRAKYMRTTTAAGPAINITTASSVTVT